MAPTTLILDREVPRIYDFYEMYNRETAIEVVAKRAGGAPIIAVVLARAAVCLANQERQSDSKMMRILVGNCDEISPEKSA